MKNTRFMERLFSACNEGDEQLVNQVDGDIKSAEQNGKFEDDELSYVNLGEGKVLVTDKANKEQTVIERADEENYDMYPAEVAQQSGQIEGFIHPEGDGVTPGKQVGTPDEHVEAHMDGQSVISPNLPTGGLNMEAGHEKSVVETAQEGPQGAEVACPNCGKTPCECEEEEEKEYSNTVVARLVDDQFFLERLFSEVIESEDTAKVGDLKIEKVEGEDAVVVTDENSGDQAKVKIDGDELEVTELDSKNFSDEDEESEEEGEEAEEDEEGEEMPEGVEGYMPLHVVGVDVINHQLIDATEYDEESAQELVARLTEAGVEAVNVFDNADDARDYAISLLGNLGAESTDDVEEPEQAEFSDHTVYVTRYYSNHSELMDRLFSEACSGECPSQDVIEDAIEKGDEIEVDGSIITPVDSKTAVIEDKGNGEFTKATMKDDSVEYDHISEKEAEDLTKDLAVEDKDEEDEEEKEYSDIEDEEYYDERDFSDVACNEEQTKFFSIHEDLTDYMQRLFSEEADEKEIEDAIESGEQIENDTEVITPVDSETAVIEDKKNGEFTKAVMDDDKLDLSPISEEEADELTKDLAVEDKEEENEEKPEEKEEEKKYSMNPNVMDKFFAEAGITAPAAEAGGMTTQEVQLAPGQSVVIVDEDGNPVEQPEEGEEQAAPVPSVEAIEDKAMAAVQSIQAAASEAQAQILNAKAAPAENQEADLQEAQFSYEDDEDEERTFSENDTLISWLSGNIK